MRSVSSRQNAFVRSFRTAARDVDSERVLLDGAHLIREAFAAQLTIESVAITHRALATHDEASTVARTLERAGADVAAVPDQVMTAISPVRSPSGIVALALHRTSPLGDTLSRPGSLVVAAVDVQDPGNLGALVRAAEAGGATGVIAAGSSAHPLSWKALRGSMGSGLRLPIAVADTRHMIAHADEAGVRVVAAVARDGLTPTEIDLRVPTLLVIGGEGRGLPPNIVDTCHALVTIPMTSPVESLNVAVAAALLVYEARRQRGTASHSPGPEVAS